MTDKHDDTFDLPADTTSAARAGRNLRPVDPKALTVAMMTPDSDVNMPGRSHAGSVVSNLISLAIGESYTKSLPIDDDITAGEIVVNFPSWKEKLRQSVNQSIRHAKKYDDRGFTMESTITTTPTGKTYLQVIVTRVE